MKPYIITQSKGKFYDLIFYIPVYFLFRWFTISFVDPTARRAGYVFFGVYYGLPLWLIYLIYDYIKCKRNDKETVRIDSINVKICGVNSELLLEWEQIEKIEIVNGLGTKIVFHLKHKIIQEIDMYGYQSTFKLIKALRH